MPALDESDNYDAARMASVLGIHLVGQVLDEACTIATAAQRIGWPWMCVLSIFKDAKNGSLTLPNQDLFNTSQGDNEISMENKEPNPNVITSTPHKGDLPKSKAENSYIGQGDEEVNRRQDELSNSTSTFINHLFDMSEVEKEIIREEITIVPVEPDETNTQMVIKITETLLNNAFDTATDRVVEVVEMVEILDEKLNSPEESCYSFLADAYEADDEGKNIAFYEDDDVPVKDEDKLEEIDLIPVVIEPLEDDEKLEKCDVARYENAYLTLNRDYDQCSDEVGDPILQDPKALVMQDVELMTASTSEDNLSSSREAEEARKALAATSAISGASGSRKSRSSLMSRCRTQGARLLSCLRGWWRRKAPGKRKEARTPGAVRGLCPLSPDARRRAASLLDNRELYTPPAPRSVVWKFNTVNEALVNSSRWKDYTFEVSPSDNVEFQN